MVSYSWNLRFQKLLLQLSWIPFFGPMCFGGPRTTFLKSHAGAKTCWPSSRRISNRRCWCCFCFQTQGVLGSFGGWTRIMDSVSNPAGFLG